MERVDDLIDRKREIRGYYRKQLKSPPGTTMNPEAAGTVNGTWMPTVVFNEGTGVAVETLRTVFLDEEIDASVFFHPLSSLLMFSERPRNENARRISKAATNLPSYQEITFDKQDSVVAVIRRVYNELSKEM